MALCGQCNSKVDRDDELKIQCGDCHKFYHGACVSLQTSDILFMNKEKRPWRCFKCANARKGNHDDRIISSPIQQSTVTTKRNTAVMQQDSDLLNEIKLLRHDFNIKLDSLSSEFKTSDKKFHEKINALLLENKQLKLENDKLSSRLNSLEQLNFNNCIDIIGIPRNTDENTMNVVDSFFTKCLGLDSKPENIEAVFRKSTVNNHHPIHVKLTSVDAKNAVLTALKKKGVDNRIFVNQCLIPAYRLLYNAVQNAKKAGKCKFGWISNGKILVRKHIGGKVTKLTLLLMILTIFVCGFLGLY